MEPIDTAELHRLRRRCDYADARALLAPHLSEAEPAAEALILAGRVDLEAGDTMAALDRFDAAIAVAPDEPDAYPWRVAALHRLYRWADAERTAVAATERFPGAAQVWVAYGRLLDDTLRRREALDALDTAVASVPDDPVAVEWRIGVLRSLDRCDEAEQTARDAVRRFPGEADLHSELGFTLSQTGRYPGALEAFAAAAVAGPDRPYIPRWQAVRMRWLGRFDEAERLLRAAIEAFPNAAIPCSALADLDLYRGRFAEAVRWSEEAVRRKPLDLRALQDHIDVLQSTARLEDAEQATRAALETAPWDATLWVKLADVLSAQDRDEEALVACERALDAQPTLLSAMERRIDTLDDVGRAKDAMAAAEEYARRYPDETRLLNKLASVRRINNRYEDAERTYERLLERDPLDLSALIGRIRTLRAQSRDAEALRAAEQGRDLRPHDTEFDDERASCLWNLGEHTKALAQLDGVLAVDPYDLALQKRRVDWLRWLGRGAEAEAHARHAAELCPDYANTAVMLADAQRQRGHAEEAVATLRAAIDRFGPGDLPYLASWLLSPLLDLGRYTEALRLVERVLDAHPEDETFQEWHVFLLRIVRRFTDAEETARTYLGRRPRSTDLLLETARLYRDLDRYTDALHRVDAALETDPDHWAVWGLKINLLQDLRQYDEAEALTRSAVERYPHAVPFHRELGWTADLRARYEEALAAMERALELDPRDVVSIRARAVILRRLCRYDDAAGALSAALDARPDERLYLLSALADVYDAAGRYDDALRCLDEILAGDPYDVRSAIAKANVLRSQRRYDQAEQLLTPLVERYIYNQAVRAALGWTHRDQGRLAEAERDFQRLLDDAACPSERASALYGLGWLELDRRDTARARERFGKALEARPHSVDARHGLAWALVRAEDAGLLPEAERLCLDLLDERPRDAEACVCLGVINFRLRRYAQAEHYLRRSLEFDPHGGSRVDLGALYVQLRRYDEAREQLDLALELDWYDAQAHIEAGNLRLRRLTEEGTEDGAAVEAARHFRQALDIDPPNGAATIGLALALAQGGEGGLAEAERVLRRSLDGPCRHPKWQLHLTLARLLIQNGDVTQRAQMYEDALTEAQAAIELKPDAAEPRFDAGVAEYKLGQGGADLPMRALRRFRARAHLRRYLELEPSDVEAQRVLRLIEQDVHAARRSAYSSALLSGISVALLVALWAAFLLTDRVTPAMMMTLTPVMVGLVGIGLVLPLLVRLKLPGGVEADLAASLNQISSGPPGTPDPAGRAGGFERVEVAVSPGPYGAIGRRE